MNNLTEDTADFFIDPLLGESGVALSMSNPAEAAHEN